MKKKGRNLNGEGPRYPHDVHWYADDEIRELMRREMFERGIREVSEYHRLKLYGRRGKARLELLREKHRRSGISDRQIMGDLL